MSKPAAIQRRRSGPTRSRTDAGGWLLAQPCTEVVLGPAPRTKGLVLFRSSSSCVATPGRASLPAVGAGTPPAKGPSRCVRTLLFWSVGTRRESLGE